ncbi:hypothetical protein DSL92_04705 [Billgrantia gudaonensis]|uniref:Methyl-accepting transducer domain-containing protein n=1 Tax=Billgrantia gudaonensis TaxID=376427 RepID=A0A3S0QFZ5_9GAMM|nr:hypothetical protein DSL92_04705 [Halomonas gudaonensis]
MSTQTQQQASALEQTASSLEEPLRPWRRMPERAHDVNRSANDASDKAREGDAVIQQFLTTMEAIHGHSDEIQSIIALIESIAFQTNILALNAWWKRPAPATRAAVSPWWLMEVRDLATRSADAAREIRHRIQASRTSVEQGTLRARRRRTTGRFSPPSNGSAC